MQENVFSTQSTGHQADAFFVGPLSRTFLYLILQAWVQRSVQELKGLPQHVVDRIPRKPVRRVYAYLAKKRTE